MDARRIGWRALACLITAAMPLSTRATELGTSNFPTGAQTVAAAFLPPPGTTAFFGYFLYYSADSFRDGDGRSSIPGFQADVVAAAARVVHTWGSYNGVNFSVGGVVEPVYLKVRAAGESDDMAGMNLLCLEPLDITTAIGNWHWMSSTLIYIPVGRYDRDALANSSTHYGGITQQAAVTWLPNARWDISLNPNISFNFRNRANDYRSGTLLGLTAGVNYRPIAGDPRWQLGLSGFYVRQITDDRIDGDKVAGGFRLRKSALGPQLTFWPSAAVALQLKWHHEFDVENAPQGELAWFELVFPL